MEGYRTDDSRSERKIQEYREAERVLNHYPGLLKTLSDWCGPGVEPDTTLSFDQVLNIATTDKSARNAIKQYLSGIWRTKDEYADSARERLAWELLGRSGF